MNILVLGNGFDLAHELPTKYTHFLKFVEVIKQVMEMTDDSNWINIDWKGIHPQIIEFIIKNAGDSKNDLFLLSRKSKWKELLNDNIWIEYFLNCDMYQKENWIDFESEISEIIQSIDKDMKKNKANDNDIVKKITNDFLEKYFLGDLDAREQPRNEGEHPIESQKKVISVISYKSLVSRLEQDLNKLIRALEIYLTDYIGNIGTKVVSPDIQSITIDKVLSFNYTDTFNRLYDDEEKNIEYDYIHGKAHIDNTIETNNMVLGIDEYLPKKRKDKETEFIAFKKFYQRIHKQTGSTYKERL